MVIMPTMIQSCKIFPSGEIVTGTPVITDSPVPGSSVTIQAQYQIQVVVSPGQIDTYDFIFWNVDATPTPPQLTGATPDPKQMITFPAPNDDSTFDATAWYILTGPGGGSGGVVYAFSQNQDKELSNSPIGTIIPASAQTGPNTFSTTTNVVVTAPAVIVGYGRFSQWLPIFEKPVNDPVLTVPANGAIVAIAFYGIPVPDPCQGLRDDLANWDCTGALNYADCVKEEVRLMNELRACEKYYGEKPGV